MTEFGDNVKKNKTYRVVVGCGNVYITIELNEDNSIHKVKMQQHNKLHCSLAVLKPLFRSVTFETRRDIKQTIKDHKAPLDKKTGEFIKCKMFNIGVKSAMHRGELWAYSCSDAIAKVLEKYLEEQKGGESEKK